MNKPLRKKKCKVCKEYFIPERQFQEACTIAHAIELGKIKLEAKKKKQNTKQKKDFKLNDKRLQLKLAQIEFNKFIRLRDDKEPCISCQRHHTGQYHAGHYRSRGAHPELAFNEDNCHKQCAQCNTYNSGNITDYRINLKIKIGKERLDFIEGYHEPVNRTLEDIIEIRNTYKNKAKELALNT